MTESTDDNSDSDVPDQTIEASFAVLELCLEQLACVAPIDSIQQIVDIVPDLFSPTGRLVLVELIKFDMAAAHEAGQPRRLEFYWPDLEEYLPESSVPLDLVLEEIQLRRDRGEAFAHAEYAERFPAMQATIGRFLSGNNEDTLPSEPSELPQLEVQSLVDDFFILKELGKGAFARVYLARQESMYRLVALKASRRGSDEPQALSQLDHPNIVRVYDQREIENPKATLLYMQYLPGGTLADCIELAGTEERSSWGGATLLRSIDKHLLDSSQSVPERSMVRAKLSAMTWPEAVAWIGAQLAEGLAYANEKNVLHRDVKPANILLSAEAIPKLADFNVSCSGLTGRAGAAAYFGGSLAYMSPEQLEVADATNERQAEELDGRSDLYALGILLWEFWRGKRPWQSEQIADNWIELIQKQHAMRAAPIEQVAGEHSAVERVLEKALRRLLAFDPIERPQNGTQAAASLRLALHPEMAQRFEPSPRSLAGRALRLPPVVLAAMVIFLPNIAASAFNFLYNQGRMHTDFVESGIAPEMERDFEFVANWVNGSVFPIGAIIFVLIMLPIQRMLRRKEGQISSGDLDLLWGLGNKAAIIGIVLWTLSGIVFAVVFSAMHEEFDGDDAVHFFLSLVLCGGVAWIYPYFGMSLVSVLVYYPKLIAENLQDSDFARRAAKLRMWNSLYLFAAAAIPLLAIGLLVLRAELPRGLVVGGVIITLCGLVAAFLAQSRLNRVVNQYSKLLESSTEEFF